MVQSGGGGRLYRHHFLSRPRNHKTFFVHPRYRSEGRGSQAFDILGAVDAPDYNLHSGRNLHSSSTEPKDPKNGGRGKVQEDKWRHAAAPGFVHWGFYWCHTGLFMSFIYIHPKKIIGTPSRNSTTKFVRHQPPPKVDLQSKIRGDPIGRLGRRIQIEGGNPESLGPSLYFLFGSNLMSDRIGR